MIPLRRIGLFALSLLASAVGPAWAERSHSLDVFIWPEYIDPEVVEAFEAEYGRLPSLYASQGYDTANLLLSAMAAADVSDRDAFRSALKAAGGTSLATSAPSENDPATRAEKHSIARCPCAWGLKTRLP